MKEQFWFPTMSIPEIIGALSGWGLAVSHEQITKPSPEFVFTIYTSCLQQVTSITEDTLSEAIQTALATLDDRNGDIYSYSLAHNVIIYHITRFATAAKIPSFSSRDVTFPEPERTRDNLSAFVNFVKFSEQCSQFLNGARSKDGEVMQERESLALRIQERRSKLDALKAQRALDEPKCEELKRERADITAKLIQYKEFNTNQVKASEKLKAEKGDLLRRRENLISEVARVSDAIASTRSRIVQSPERIKTNISSMNLTAVDSKRILASNEAKARDLREKVAALADIENDFRACGDQLKGIAKEVQAIETSQKQLDDIKDTLYNKKVEKNDLEMRYERVRQQLLNAQDKLERAQKHSEEKRIASQQTIDRLKKEYEEMALERRDNDKQVEELRKEANETERSMADHLKQNETELGELLNEYWELRQATEVYMETLADRLGMRVSSNS
ncbi:hypothetical protein JAAARDRAFT_553066 [Jaapia argillacea MUCL 33604]|uniref:Uncharacterized protein n=1 Tax=Jaapia argillacea MUCL 33604 TaxID=933084 RepID=A0A067Q316_9AGAM|nr:hypothetical protein JAAARDRAFT_553066 [Jaapia argillacea MUCL 33604]